MVGAFADSLSTERFHRTKNNYYFLRDRKKELHCFQGLTRLTRPLSSQSIEPHAPNLRMHLQSLESQQNYFFQQFLEARRAITVSLIVRFLKIILNIPLVVSLSIHLIVRTIPVSSQFVPRCVVIAIGNSLSLEFMSQARFREDTYFYSPWRASTCKSTLNQNLCSLYLQMRQRRDV